ncbi:MAG TPA: ABC transporter ATP-binding protein [Pirellulaceae bacterium]|nr:ABC transporter ATP-binding protein [Pirellulaceae bacterium]
MLELRDIRKSFRQPGGRVVEILDLPEYSVAEKEQCVLWGPSGCGKTTLLHIIAGIVRPDTGTVTLDRVRLSQYSEAKRDQIRADKLGYVFQTFNLLDPFSALENVLLGMTFSSVRPSRRRARELLERVGLKHRMRNRPRELSVGEQQRVAVARALANRPKLLLADEPTANVDPANQQTIIDLIRSCCRDEGIALVMVTHSTEVAEQFSRVDHLNQMNLVMQRARATS